MGRQTLIVKRREKEDRVVVDRKIQLAAAQKHMIVWKPNQQHLSKESKRHLKLKGLKRISRPIQEQAVAFE